jgi:hypothetical protein
MSTTNLKLENIFPSYELLDTVATKASIVDAISTTGASDNDALVVNGVSLQLVGALGGTTGVSATGTLTIPGAFAQTDAGATVTIGNVILTEGTDWVMDGGGTSANTVASKINAAINSDSTYSSTVSGNVITVTATAGANTDQTVASLPAKTVWTNSQLTGGLDATPTDAIHVLRGTDPQARNRIRLAINGTEDVNIQYGSSLDTAEGVDGVKATNGTGADDLSLETEVVGAYSLTLTNTTGSLATTAGLVVTTGGSATGAISINLSDLDITDNALTVGETQDETGDYRQLIYHVIRKYQEYLDLQESVSTVTSVGGANYTVGDALVFTGGGPSVAASGTVSGIDGSGNPNAFTLSYGSGYTSVPTVSISSASATTVATTGATLTSNAPSQLAVTKGTLTENTSTGIISRAWTVSFGFNESGLGLATD